MTASIALALLGMVGSSGLVQAHSKDEHASHGQQAAETREEGARVSFVDVPLLDQDGKSVRLNEDLVRDRIVVMGFIYTSCTTVCPVVSSIMSKVQKQLGGRVGDDVQLVSISIDPQRDDPPRLLGYAKKFQSGPGWSWLTGSPQAISDTLKGLGTWTPDFRNHPPLILVGDGRSERWTRYYGFTDPALLVKRVQELGAARVHARHTAVAMEQLP
nr:SCO family protein [Pseudomonas akapageensis]